MESEFMKRYGSHAKATAYKSYSPEKRVVKRKSQPPVPIRQPVRLGELIQDFEGIINHPDRNDIVRKLFK